MAKAAIAELEKERESSRGRKIESQLRGEDESDYSSGGTRTHEATA